MLTRSILMLILALFCIGLFNHSSAYAYYGTSTINTNYVNQVADPTAPSCIIREGLQVMMQNVRDEIDKDTDGHVELSFRNPLINDCVIQAELRIITPNELLVFGKEGVVSGGAGTLNAVATVPPGTERISVMDFKGVQQGDNLIIRFSGNYWPVGNKSAAQGVSTKVSMSVVEASSEASIAQENENAVVPDDRSSQNILNEMSGSNNMVMMGVIIIILVVLVIILFMIVIMRRR